MKRCGTLGEKSSRKSGRKHPRNKREIEIAPLGMIKFRGKRDNIVEGDRADVQRLKRRVLLEKLREGMRMYKRAAFHAERF